MIIEDPETGFKFCSIEDAKWYWCVERPGHPNGCSECPILDLKKRYHGDCDTMCMNHTDEVLDAIGFQYVWQKFNESGLRSLIGGAAL